MSLSWESVGALRKHAGGMFLASDLGGYAAVASILTSTAPSGNADCHASLLTYLAMTGRETFRFLLTFRRGRGLLYGNAVDGNLVELLSPLSMELFSIFIDISPLFLYSVLAKFQRDIQAASGPR